MKRSRTLRKLELAGIIGLMGSIKTSGQDTAVDMRPNPKGKGGKKYSLVTGFRRFEAIEAT